MSNETNELPDMIIEKSTSIFSGDSVNIRRDDVLRVGRTITVHQWRSAVSIHYCNEHSIDDAKWLHAALGKAIEIAEQMEREAT